jgi:hypothetical protein
MSFLIESLIERLDDETGISLANSEIEATCVDGSIEIYVWNQLLIIADDVDSDMLEDEGFASEVWELMTDEFYDVREKLIELKLASLNTDHLPTLAPQLISLLETQKVDKKVLENLDFSFEDISSIDKDFGLPKVGICFTDYEAVKVLVPVDISKKPYNFDPATIAKEFDVRFKAKV